MVSNARELRRTRTGDIADRVAARRTKLQRDRGAEFTQEACAKRLGDLLGFKFAGAQWSQMERSGEGVLEKIEGIALVLDCTPAYLLGWTENPKKQTMDKPLEEYVGTRVYLDAIPPPLELFDGLGLDQGLPVQLPAVRSVRSVT